jgi:hypothetical protein
MSKSIINTKTREVVTTGLTDVMIEWITIERKWQKNPDLQVMEDSDIGETYVDEDGVQYMKK